MNRSYAKPNFYFSDINPTNAYNITASFIYEYSFNKKISLSANVDYIFQKVEFKDVLINSVMGNPNGINLHQFEIPLIFNYRLPLHTDVNFVGGIGFSALINIKNNYSINSNLNANLSIKNDVTPNLILHAGFEFMTLTRTQLLFTYKYALMENYNFISNSFLQESFRVNIFNVSLRFLI